MRQEAAGLGEELEEIPTRQQVRAAVLAVELEQVVVTVPAPVHHVVSARALHLLA